MKANKSILGSRYLFPDSGFKSFLLNYKFLYLFTIVLMILNAILGNSKIFSYDSPSYLNASYSLLNYGQIDALRTPVYPFIIGLMRFIFGESNQVGAVIILQAITFLFSIFYFQKLLKKFFQSDRIIFILMIVYIFGSQMLFRYNTVLTESFSMGAIVFLLWTFFRDLPNKLRVSSALFAGFWSLMLIFIRPGFLCILPAYLLFVLYPLIAKSKNFKSFIAGVCCFFIIIGLLVAYKNVVSKTYNINSISIVTNANNFSFVRGADILEPYHSSDANFKKYLTNPHIYRNYDNKEIFCREREDAAIMEHVYITDSLKIKPAVLEEAVNNAIKSNIPAASKYLIYRLALGISPQPFIYPALISPNNKITGNQMIVINLKALGLNFGFTNFLMIIVTIWLICNIRKNNTVYMSFWIIWLLISCILASTYIGAPNDWTRLSIYAIPGFLILITQCIIKIGNALKNKNLTMK